MPITRKENIVARTINGSFFLIDFSDNYSGDKCSIYEVNQTGMFIWNNINGSRSIEELAELLQKEIVEDIDFKILYNDVYEFVSILMENQFLEA